jgi:phosphatidylserine/phosphatidylglycerophosphate/cardiolipin synthase-like enzyme
MLGKRGRLVVWLAAAGLLVAGCGVQKTAAPKATTTTTSPRPTTTTTAKAAAAKTAAHASAPVHSSTSPASPAAPAWSLVVEPNDGMQPIYSLMSSARHTLDMTMYELSDPETVSILDADAARGVRVRVLLDEDYSGASVNAGDYAALAAHGVQVKWANAGTIFHQKSITVDGATSAIMTLNLTSDDYATTRDFAVITTDASDVSAIENVFASDWSSSGPPGPSSAGAGLVWSPGSTGALVSLIDSAQHSLLVENEEMDDPTIESALESAAGRGVNVDVVMTYSSDWTTAWTQLVGAGVHVRTYASDASLYIHAKAIIADGSTAFVGSENFSEASLDYNRELGLITTVAALVSGMSATVQADYAGGTPFSASPPPAPSTPAATAPASSGASCQATAAPANDGYSGDYDVSVTSNQPDTKATASDATDTWSDDTNSSGSVVIVLYHGSPGESVTVTVGGATCTTTT